MVPPSTWEKVNEDDNNSLVYRLAIPGGFLYKTVTYIPEGPVGVLSRPHVNVVFVPRKSHD